MKTIYLVRHGDAEVSWACRDCDRQLTACGYQQATRVGVFFKRHSVVPDIVVTSGYVRAEQTATAILAQCGGVPERLTFLTFSPSGSSEEMKTILEGLPEDACILVVGHLPSIVYLAHVLSEAFPEGVSFGNCTMAAFEGEVGKMDFLFHKYNEELV